MRRSEQPVVVDALVLFRALPHHAGKTLQRRQRLAGIGPLLQLFDGNMVERLPPGAAMEKRARDVDHMRRTRALIEQRRTASRAKASRGFCSLVFEAGNPGHSLDDAKTLAPTADVSGLSGTMPPPACAGMIVPGPAGGIIDLEANRAAKATARDG